MKAQMTRRSFSAALGLGAVAASATADVPTGDDLATLTRLIRAYQPARDAYHGNFVVYHEAMQRIEHAARAAGRPLADCPPLYRDQYDRMRAASERYREIRDALIVLVLAIHGRPAANTDSDLTPREPVAVVAAGHLLTVLQGDHADEEFELAVVPIADVLRV